MTTADVPEIEAGWALFLDLDGTLIDLAPTPDSVVVPPGLTVALAVLARRLDGALAIVTGRARTTVDALLAPLVLPGGFGHGAELRDATGHCRSDSAIMPLPPSWVDDLSDSIRAWPGVLLERKPHGLALHFRTAPEYGEAAHAALTALLRGHEAHFALLPAHMAYEIRPRLATKGRAVDALMAGAPFRGRRPVFVGDDVTDEDGMQAARRHGGFGLHVGQDFRYGPAEVRAWVARAAARYSQE